MSVNFLKRLVIFLMVIYSIFGMSNVASAEMRFVHSGGAFNFSIASDGWLGAPNEPDYLGIMPEMTLVRDAADEKIVLSVSKLDPGIYSSSISGAFDIISGKIKDDPSVFVVMSNSFSHNGVAFKDIIFKKKTDLLNTRALLVKDLLRSPAAAQEMLLIIFHFSKKSDLVESSGEVDSLVKSFSFGTGLANVVSRKFINKPFDAIGEFLSLNETRNGEAWLLSEGVKAPVYSGDHLIKLGSVLETLDSSSALKLNDGTLFFVNQNSKLNFHNIGEVEMAHGEVLMMTERLSGVFDLNAGKFVKISTGSGKILVSLRTDEEASISEIKISVLAGHCDIRAENIRKNSFKKQTLNAGQTVIVKITNSGTVKSFKAENGGSESAAGGSDQWAAPLMTHKTYKAQAYLKKILDYKK